MRKLVFLVLLAGCATQPRQPTQAQLAMWSYWSTLCGRPANAENVVYQLQADAALRGCVITHAMQATAAYNATQGPTVLEGLGSVYLEAGRGGRGVTNCTSLQDHTGAWITSCY